MSNSPTSQPKYVDDSLGQRRRLRSKLMDTLAKLFIASLAGCAFAATASRGGTRPLLETLSIVVGLLLISVAFVLVRYFRARGKIIATAREHARH